MRSRDANAIIVSRALTLYRCCSRAPRAQLSCWSYQPRGVSAVVEQGSGEAVSTETVPRISARMELELAIDPSPLPAISGMGLKRNPRQLVNCRGRFVTI